MKSKTLKTIVFLIAATLPLCSCQKEIKYMHAGDGVRFTAGSGFAQTKASYSGATNSAGTIERIDWQAGDLLRIYCAQASEPAQKFADYKVTSVDSPASGSAVSTAHIETFSDATDGVGLRWGESSHIFYAAFPSPATTGGITTSISGNEVTANLSGSQTPASVTTSGVNYTAVADLSNMLMTAKAGPYTAETMPDENSVFLAFTPLTTAVKFTITNQSKADLTVKSVSLISDSSALNGPFSVDIDDVSHQPSSINLGGTTVSYAHSYPYCQYTGSVTAATKTVTINFASPITLAYDANIANCGSLTFTFFLQPCQNFDDLTFKLVKSDDSWMSTKLGYTDGTGILFPRFKKTEVKGVFVPEGAQWTVNYSPTVQSWNQSNADINPMPETDGDPFVTSWDTGIDEELTLNPKDNEDLLPGKFSVSETHYVQFSRGNLMATRSSSSSDDWKLGFFANQYDYGKATSFTANDTEMSLFTFGFDSKATSFDPIGQTSGSEDWGNEYNRQYSLPSGTWQTLTGGPGEEWWYLLDGRPNAANLKAIKTVHGISNCLIIFPDGFDLSDIPSSTELTDDQWSDLEAKGAVCLPQAGLRFTSAYYTNSSGYWANNSYGASLAYGAFFTSPPTVVSYSGGVRNYGYSVRLVQKFDWPEVEPTFVDLGLPSGTLWADVNVGAVSKTGVGSYGKYYAWGETAAYLELMTGYGSWAGAKNANYVEGVIKQHVNNNYWKWLFPSGSTAKYKSKDLMLPEDDIATQKYGDGCHIPTMDQWYELFNDEYCTWTWDASKNGHIVTSVKYPGRSIFIPQAGYYKESGNLTYDGTKARFWSSDYWNSIAQNCVYINPASGGKSGSGLSDYGTVLTIRAVKDPVHD